MDIKAKYGKIWILKTILETLKQAKNMFFVHFIVKENYFFLYNFGAIKFVEG